MKNHIDEIWQGAGKKQVTAVVLAGGRARRMGGEDKGLIEFNGICMAARAVNQIRGQASSTMINANRHLDQYRKFAPTVFPDGLDDYQGPLAGMLAALERLETEWLITVPCDGPFISENYVQRMFDAALEQERKIVTAMFAGRLQPVYALIHASLRQSLGVFLDSGERKIDRWYSEHDFATVNFDDSPRMFLNVNSHEELAKLESEYPENT